MSEIKIYEEKMEKSLAALEADYATIRAGRAIRIFLIKLKLIITEHHHRFSR